MTWGTNPGQALGISASIPHPSNENEERALRYMDLRPGTALQDIAVDRVFIGSCTNARLTDLQAAAAVVRGRQVHPKVRAMVVPGSAAVKLEAEALGLDRVFVDAGFEWRDAGCSMCLGMNPDILQPGERCASTSNRNFEGRQGSGGRTHLLSPPMAAAAALAGHLTDVRDLDWASRFRPEPPDLKGADPCRRFVARRAGWRRLTAATWTPTRSSPSSS